MNEEKFDWSTHQRLEETWPGDHPMYKTIEGFVISIVGEFDDEEKGVSFNEIYEVVNDYQSVESPHGLHPPTRSYIKRILDSYIKGGVLIVRDGLYYFSDLGRIVHTDITHEELVPLPGSIHYQGTDVFGRDKASLFIYGLGKSEGLEEWEKD